MSTNYAGNPANYPANIRVPDDGDLSNATKLAEVLEDLGDRTANLNARAAIIEAYALPNLHVELDGDLSGSSAITGDNTEPLPVAGMNIDFAAPTGAKLRMKMGPVRSYTLDAGGKGGQLYARLLKGSGVLSERRFITPCATPLLGVSDQLLCMIIQSCEWWHTVASGGTDFHLQIWASFADVTSGAWYLTTDGLWQLLSVERYVS